MKSFIILTIGLFLLLSGCTYIPLGQKENYSKSNFTHMQRYDGFSGQEKELTECTKGEDTKYIVSTVGVDIGTKYYYDKNGNELDQVQWAVPHSFVLDIVIPATSVNLSGYKCQVIRSSELDQRPIIFAAVNKTISQGSDQFYFLDGKKKNIDNACNQKDVTLVLDNSSKIGDGIRWLAKNHPDASVLSWWDYGNALECSGLRSLTSSKDLGDPNILETAYSFVDGNESDLAKLMMRRDFEYVMMPNELVQNPTTLNFSFGGKYSAIDYLSCIRKKQSKCEENHLWKTDGKNSSILYRSIVLDNLSGFDREYVKGWGHARRNFSKIYDNGQVKIYELPYINRSIID